MPKPKEGEKKDEFMSRCIPMLIDEGKKQDQAIAICGSMWEQDHKKSYDEIIEEFENNLRAKNKGKK